LEDKKEEYKVNLEDLISNEFITMSKSQYTSKYQHYLDAIDLINFKKGQSLKKGYTNSFLKKSLSCSKLNDEAKVAIFCANLN
jgi:hypothetical protein